MILCKNAIYKVSISIEIYFEWKNVYTKQKRTYCRKYNNIVEYKTEIYVVSAVASRRSF